MAQGTNKNLVLQVWFAGDTVLFSEFCLMLSSGVLKYEISIQDHPYLLVTFLGTGDFRLPK